MNDLELKKLQKRLKSFEKKEDKKDASPPPKMVFMQVFIDLVAIMGVAILLGYGIGNYCNLQIVGILIGFLLGVIACFWHLYKILKKEGAP